MRSNVNGLEAVKITTVIVTPVRAASSGARPHLEGVYLWPLHEFREWAELALTTLREIRKNLAGHSDILWRPDAISVLRREGVDFQSLLQMIRNRPATEVLEFR